ncbi:MAG: 4Fe-4S ferredoxin [Deltaproteobacteria bacterium HGW-Deltaproteobacteria-19]|jgi:epoxyqueuosine reductase QueG|nr:MAG: 4Fe-4S ferredoxin [Deltaproteobacteria bacterium HGW-Deltaproteobacteria-19]
MSKEEIRKYGLELGADVVGFAAAGDYKSPRTPELTAVLPSVKSVVVLGYREVDGSLDSPNPRTSMTERFGIMDVAQKNNYLMARWLENRFRAKAAAVALSYPLNMGAPYFGLVADVSLRHAAVAAGLGVFGRHNLVIHPKFGTRLIFTAILTDLPLSSDPPVTEELCNDCGLCVDICPAKALETEGRTENMKCLRVSQPYGIGSAIGFLRKLAGAAPEEQKAMFMDPRFLSLYQASFIGFQYECFRCLAVCPAGR